ncbi:unnamed protein product [Meloidogyne enterolobii]|uniref:Uncharacterized protein n=1 Tax=Meloidogyne enterolobii TaxID=390850 RepID=A0ACB1ADT2_MELEN
MRIRIPRSVSVTSSGFFLTSTIKYKLNKNFLLGEDYLKYSPQFPKVLKVISVVRHGERLDNDKEEKKKALEREEQCYYNEDCSRKFGLDNSPLNETGIKRATILRKV